MSRMSFGPYRALSESLILILRQGRNIVSQARDVIGRVGRAAAGIAPVHELVVEVQQRISPAQIGK